MPGRIDGLILRSSPSARGVWFVGWSKRLAAVRSGERVVGVERVALRE